METKIIITVIIATIAALCSEMRSAFTDADHYGASNMAVIDAALALPAGDCYKGPSHGN